MEKNFNDMTLKDLQKLQELLSIEIRKREVEERENAKGKIHELFEEIEKICTDNTFALYHSGKYNDDYEISLSDIFVI